MCIYMYVCVCMYVEGVYRCILQGVLVCWACIPLQSSSLPVSWQKLWSATDEPKYTIASVKDLQ